jgi:hypothetical protein
MTLRSARSNPDKPAFKAGRPSTAYIVHRDDRQRITGGSFGPSPIETAARISLRGMIVLVRLATRVVRRIGGLE